MFDEERQAANREAASAALHEMVNDMSNEAGWWIDATCESIATLPGASALVGREADKRHSANREVAEAALSAMASDISHRAGKAASDLSRLVDSLRAPMSLTRSTGRPLSTSRKAWRNLPSVVTWTAGIRPAPSNWATSSTVLRPAIPHVLPPDVLARQEANRQIALAALSEFVDDVSTVARAPLYSSLAYASEQAGSLGVSEWSRSRHRNDWARLPSVVTWTTNLTSRPTYASQAGSFPEVLNIPLQGEMPWAAVSEALEWPGKLGRGALDALPLHVGGNLGRIPVEGAGIVQGRSREEVAEWLEANNLAGELGDAFAEAAVDGAALQKLAQHWDADPTGFVRQAGDRFGCGFAAALRLGAALSRLDKFIWPPRDERRIALNRRRAARQCVFQGAVASRVQKEHFEAWRRSWVKAIYHIKVLVRLSGRRLKALMVRAFAEHRRWATRCRRARKAGAALTQFCRRKMLRVGLTAFQSAANMRKRAAALRSRREASALRLLQPLDS
jgi:hypothetical protein